MKRQGHKKKDPRLILGRSLFKGEGTGKGDGVLSATLLRRKKGTEGEIVERGRR